MSLRSLCLRVSAALSLAPAVLAQTPISGTLYDGAGGPLQSGVVYHIVGAIVVPAGTTLTVGAGAILKSDGQAIYVRGALLAQGTAAQPVIFTSIHDDAAGGDTNGNGGATVPAPLQWPGITFDGAGNTGSALDRCIVRYTGGAYWAALNLMDADIAIRDGVITDAGYGGIRMDADSRPVIARTSFARIHNVPAISGAALEAVPQFTGNNATNCPGGPFLLCDHAVIPGATTLGAANLVNGAIVLGAGFHVPAGGHLRLDAGVVLKLASGIGCYVDGTLTVAGSASAPVVLTSFYDDRSGGDTNGDGNATAPAPLQWAGLRLRDGADASQLSFLRTRCTGGAYWAGVNLERCDAALLDCDIADGGYGGLAMDTSSRPRVERCSIHDIQGVPAVIGVGINALPAFLDQTISGCSAGNFVRVDDAVVSGSIAITRANVANDALVFASTLHVPSGATLDLGPGIVLKPPSGSAAYVDGQLIARGTASAPVVFTSFYDDSAAGDTNGDGSATMPAPLQWPGLRLRAGSSASALDHVSVRYTGGAYWAAVNLESSSPTLRDCELRDAGYGGLALDASSEPRVERGRFVRIGGAPAVLGATYAAVTGFLDCTASQCSGGGYLRIDSATVSRALSIGVRNQIGSALVATANLHVAASGSLSLGSGIVWKGVGGSWIHVDGELRVAGPVTFTSFYDDLYGGDTNGDGGATVGAPMQWAGLRIAAGARGALDGALVRCTGGAYWPALEASSSLFALRRTRVELTGFDGFAIADAAAAEDLEATLCGRHGIVLSSGNVALRRSTSAANAGVGFLRLGGVQGRVASSIGSWNGGGGFVGFSSNDLRYCNGSGALGSVGGLDEDPLFLDLANGDLRLHPYSPCLDRGEPSEAPTGLDLLGFPRFLDGDLDGVQRIDMGAHEHDNVLAAIFGDARPGGTLTLATFSLPPIHTVFLAIGAGSAFELPLAPYGAFFPNLFGAYVLVPWATSGSVSFSIPLEIFTPVDLVVQEVGFAGAFDRGNTSNPTFLTIR
ncbi:MAG: hypothetical protein JNM84_07880 [Planctomycetes bacterium]|nr:hypothetical protein [Planctomycetota bacterium]